MHNYFRTNPATLHITTDAITAQHLDMSIESGLFLAWQDALYEGPINPDLSLAELSFQRANYFADIGWVDRREILGRYHARNNLLIGHDQYKEIILWFDQDLNSQLQLVQLIDWFSQQKMDSTLLSLISVKRLPGISAYLGLNMMTPNNIQALMDDRWEITLGQMNLCRHAWAALGSSNPNALLRFQELDSAIMPFLKNALLRLLKQFPAQSNGLSHTENLIANGLLHQQTNVTDIFQIIQSKEGIAFMNQSIFSTYLQNMCEGERIMVEQVTLNEGVVDETEDHDSELILEQEVEQDVEQGIEGVVKPHTQQKEFLRLTDLGRQVLHNWVDWVQVKGIDRWVGGVHLREGSLWRYEESKRKLIKTYL